MLKALFVALVGMLIVFACLVAVLLVMMALGRLFQTKNDGKGSAKTEKG